MKEHVRALEHLRFDRQSINIWCAMLLLAPLELPSFNRSVK